MAGLSTESKLPQSRDGNSSSPVKPEHTQCRALHPSPAPQQTWKFQQTSKARAPNAGPRIPASRPCPLHPHPAWPPMQNWGRERLCTPWEKKEVWKMLTFNIDSQVTGSPEEPHKHQIAQGSTAKGRESKTSQLEARKSSCTNNIYFTFCLFPWYQ